MASEAILEDIDERFLQCAICLCQLKDPKSLPCLHHYCRGCLAGTVTEGARDIQCPTCREIYPLPPNGVDGFKTDFNTRNIIEFVQLRNSVKEEPVRACVACEKNLKACAYCFKCRDFLCQGCHEFHRTNTIVKDHQPHIFPVAEMEARNLTMGKLASLKEAPRCGTHPEKLSDLCCTTCGNQPICVPCIYGAHQGHDLKEVTSLAKLEREKLTGRTAELMRYKEKIYKLQEELKKSKEELDLNVTGKREELQKEFAIEEKKIRAEIKGKDEALERRKRDLEGMVKRKVAEEKQQLARELKMAQDKYDRFCRDEKRSIEAELKKLLPKDERDSLAESHQRLEVINKELRDSLASLQSQQEGNSKKIKELSDHFDDIVTRFEIVAATASSIVAARHDWTDVQCIADICSAQDALIEDMKKDYPGLGALSDVSGEGLSSATPGGGVMVNISEREESMVGIEGVTGREWFISDITGGKDGSIVITGGPQNGNSRITVINPKGEQVKQVTLQGSRSGWSYCEFISPSKVATVPYPYKIGICDIRDGTYRVANMKDISPWPAGECLRCVTVDRRNSHILVGGTHMTGVYVFDYDLRYIKTIALPEGVDWPRDMTVHEGSLLVCGRRKAWAVNMEGGSTRCKIRYEFPRPDVGGSDYNPRSVCTDRHGYIYMLWRAGISGAWRSILVQYTQDGQHLLQSRLVGCGDAAECITTVETDQGEKLLLATCETGKLITYGLST